MRGFVKPERTSDQRADVHTTLDSLQRVLFQEAVHLLYPLLCGNAPDGHKDDIAEYPLQTVFIEQLIIEHRLDGSVEDGPKKLEVNVLSDVSLALPRLMKAFPSLRRLS